MGRFKDSLMGMVPVLEDVYQIPVHAIVWQNADQINRYGDKIEPKLLEKMETVTADGKEWYLLISDSENMQRKAAVMLGTVKKFRILEQEESNGGNVVAAEAGERSCDILNIDLSLCTESESRDKYAKILKNVMEESGVLFSNLQSSQFKEENLQLILSCPCTSCFVGIREEILSEPWIQQLIHKGNFHILRLPEETDEYYKKFIIDLFMKPAVTEYIINHPGELNMEGILKESNYINKVNTDTMFKAFTLLRKKLGKRFDENIIANFLDLADENQWNFESILQKENGRDYKKLQTMVGFDEVKKVIKKRLALHRAAGRNRQINFQGQNYLFVGNPGVGKTEGAKLLYDVLSAEGCIPGSFVTASRKDIIGSYVGQTAPKVATLFEQARNGVLFVDEAGFFLQKECGGYVNEAIKEFVRFMETRRDVTVIFAMYPGEKDKFLELDAGLESRIGQIVEFSDYEEDTLCKIAHSMWETQGYRALKSCNHILSEFIKQQKRGKKEKFGNAREIRKLVELSIQETELRLMEDEAVDMCENTYTLITDIDVRNAAREIQGNKKNKNGNVGFRMEDEEKNGQTVTAWEVECEMKEYDSERLQTATA